MATSSRFLIDQASSKKRELCLFGTGTTFELTYNERLLRASPDETASALAIDTIRGLIGDRNQVDLLIGGLGFGKSLERSLEDPTLRSVVVVEVEHRLLDWARTHLGLADRLDDARTETIEGALETFVRASPQSYHGILIDVDRGPVHAVLDSSRRTYSLTTLDLLARHLRSGGVLAVCLEEEDAAYQRAMAEIFTEVGSRPVEGSTAVIYFGRS